MEHHCRLITLLITLKTSTIIDENTVDRLVINNYKATVWRELLSVEMIVTGKRDRRSNGRLNYNDCIVTIIS